MAEKSATAGDRLALSEAAYERLSLRHDSLAAKVDYLSTSEGVESEIRTKFRAVEEGESVAVIVSEPGAKADISSSTSRTVTKRSWWQKIAWMLGM